MIDESPHTKAAHYDVVSGAKTAIDEFIENYSKRMRYNGY
jgi:hypothetical protein